MLGALEVVRTLNDPGVATRRPLAVVNWTNEEGVRFEPAMQCSGAVTGRFTPERLRPHRSRGATFEDELRRIGYLGERGNRPCRRRLPGAAHRAGSGAGGGGVPVGVVGGIVGITWIEVTVEGRADHAGPSPMRLRRDALAAAAQMVAGVERIALERTRSRSRRSAGSPPSRTSSTPFPARSPSASISAIPSRGAERLVAGSRAWRRRAA